MATVPTRSTAAVAVAMIAISAAAVWWTSQQTLDRPDELYQITGEIRLGVDPSYHPFAQDVGGQLQGFDIALAEALSEKIELPINLVVLSFDGLNDALLTGRVDALASVPVSTQLEDITYTSAYVDIGWVLVSPSDSALSQWQNLAGKRLSVEFASEGDSIAAGWLRRIQPFDILRYETSTDALDALALGDSDAALIPALALGQYEAPANIFNAVFITHVPLGIAVRATDTTLHARLQQALEELKSDGSVDTLIADWLGQVPDDAGN